MGAVARNAGISKGGIDLASVRTGKGETVLRIGNTARSVRGETVDGGRRDRGVRVRHVGIAHVVATLEAKDGQDVPEQQANFLPNHRQHQGEY